MSAPEEDNIYNDSPDEFAEFLDKGEPTVTLKTLGGIDNPFVREGIYEEVDDEFCYSARCPYCGMWVFSDTAPVEDGEMEMFHCTSCECGFEVTPDDCRHFAVNNEALARFVSKGIGGSTPKQYKKTGWRLGNLRGHDVYFACKPTKGMYRALESAPNSVLIIGQNTPEDLPGTLATRVIYLSRLLSFEGGSLVFAQDAIEEKIPPPRRRGQRGHEHADDQPKRKQPRPPIQVYTPYYLRMIQEWIVSLRDEHKTGTPPFKWITAWMRQNCRIENVRSVGERQVRRHIAKLLNEKQHPTHDNRHPSFLICWQGCDDENFVARFAEEDVNTVIIKAFDVARKTGFRVSPMRNMDAADYADKVRVK